MGFIRDYMVSQLGAGMPKRTVSLLFRFWPQNASGAPAVFTTRTALPLTGLTVEIEAAQAGSGTPTPTNIRAISGWTGAEVIVSPTQVAGDGTSYPVSWQTEAGTVYGGTLDVLSGKLTADKAAVDLGTLSWTKRTVSGQPVTFVAAVSDMATADTSAKRVQGLTCSHYQQSATPGVDSQMLDKTMLRIGTSIYIRDTDYDNANATAFKAAVDGATLVYPLASPATYQLTPVDVLTLAGRNYVWADCGPVYLGFLK